MILILQYEAIYLAFIFGSEKQKYLSRERDITRSIYYIITVFQPSETGIVSYSSLFSLSTYRISLYIKLGLIDSVT